MKMESVNILHLVLQPRHSGAEIFVGDLAKGWKEIGTPQMFGSLDAPDHSFSSHMERWFSIGPVATRARVERETRPSKIFNRLKHLKMIINELSPDIILAHSVIPSYYARIVVSEIPVITVLHSSDDYSGIFPRLLEKRLRKPLAIISVSPLSATNYLSRFGERVPVITIPNGINTKTFNVGAVEIFENSSINDLRTNFNKVILQVGRIDRVKNQLATIKALKVLCEMDDVNPLLIFAGIIEDKIYENELRAEIQKLSLNGRVLFLGPRDDVPDLLAYADIVVMPSFSEAHSISFLEAFAAGKPIVCSNIPAFNMTCSVGVWNFHVDRVIEYAHCMLEAFCGPKSYQRNLEHVSIDRTVSAYDDLVRRVLAEHNSWI